jgi:hypothetical protein
MILTTNKDLRKLLKEAEEAGWEFTKRERHIKGRHPNGQTATIALTPSDRRALLNIQSYLKVRKSA